MKDETNVAEMIKAMLPYMMEFSGMFGMDMAVGSDTTVIRQIPKKEVKKQNHLRLASLDGQTL